MAKKIWERMQEDAEANKLENERIRQEANQKFQQERERDNEIKNRIIQTSRLPLMNTVRTMADNANDYRQKTREQIANRVSNNFAIKTLNNMIDNVDTSNLPNTTIGNLYKTVLDTAKTMTPQQRIRPYVDIQQDSKESMIKATNYINQRLNRPLWDQIVDTASDFGRTTENTWLGGKHAVEDAGNYIDTMINGYKTQQEKTIGKAFFSNKLNNNEKWSYIISQTANRENYENTVRNKIDQAFPGLDKKMQDMIVQSEMKKFDKAFENEQLRNQVNNISNIYNNNKEKIDNIVNEDFNNRRSEDEKISKNIEQQTNPLSKKLAEIAPSIGQMGVGTALSTINPVLGTAYFTSSAGGGYLNDAIERGMTPSQAKNYATVMGLAEGLTEELTVGNFKKAGDTVKSIIKGTGKEVAKEGAKQVATQTMKEALKDYGIGIAENMLQEAVMEPLQETMAGAIGGQDKANWDNMLERMWNSGVDGGLVAVITGGTEIGLKSSLAVTDKLSKGIKPTQEEIKTAIQENIKARGQEAVNNDYIEGVNTGVNAVKNEISQQNQQTTQNNQVPVQENVSNQNIIANNQLPVQENNQKGKSFEDIVDEAMSNYESNEVPSPLQSRDIKTIGKETKVNAYQYDNPEVKPYFQEMAQMLGEDIGNIASSDNRKTTKGGGTALSANIPAIKQLKEMGYSYNQIIDGIVDIIDDHGQENNALSKKIEIILDDQLRNGYTNSYGQYIRPNEEYISLISKDNVQNNQVLPTKQLPVQENSIENNKDKTQVNQEVLDYIKKNNINMTADEFINWASNKQLEQENITDTKQQELYNLIHDIQSSTNSQEGIEYHNIVNENGKIVDKTTGKVYNIKDEIIPYISVDEEKLKYIPYSQLEEYYQNDVETMDIIANKCSSEANKRFEQGKKSGKIIHDGKEYSFEITDDNTFKIKEIRKPKTISTEVADERNINKNSRYSVSDERHRQRQSSNDIRQAGQQTTSTEIPGLDNKKSRESDGLYGNDRDSRTDVEDSNKSSFSMEEDYSNNTEENELQRKINRSMTMQEAKDMIQRAFVTGDIYNWYDGKYKNGDEWIAGEGIDDVAMWIDNDYNLQNKYINSNEDILNEEYMIEDVLEAYQNGTLTGNSDKLTQRLDTSKNTNYKDNRFYAPKDIQGGKELYEIANQRVTNANRQEVYKARADFILNAHNEGYVESLGLTQKEINEKLRNWANYPKKAMEISKFINKGVALENKWVGIENSSIVNELSISQKQLDSLVKEIKGTTNEWQRRYIANTMLAIDTHMDYTGLTYDFAPDVKNMGERALADYYAGTDTIRVRREGQNTIAHETGHFIDHLLGRKIGDGYNLGITKLCRSNIENTLNGRTYTQEQKQFLNNFNNFLSSIEDVSDIGSKYKMDSQEVFARFVARFTEWTRNTATNGRYGYEADWYKDNFTTAQYMEFAKLLQEYSKLETTGQVSSKVDKTKGNKYDQRIEDIYSELFNNQKQILPTKETSNEASINLPTKGENIDWNKVEKPEGKFRKHYQSIIESSNTTAEAKAIAKEMMGLDTYTPQSNESLLQKADRIIGNADPNTELNSLLSRAMNNDKISDTDIAVGERLIEYYSKIGDAEHLQDAIHATALAGTQAGRAVQALALLNHMTPQGQLVWLQRSIEKMNDSLEQKYKNRRNVPQFELTQEMTDKILNTNSKEEMYEVLDNVYEELGQQVPKTMSEKIDEWRYFSMLANIKTHNRNIIGNVAMHATQRVKDKVAGVIEGTVAKFNPNMERTHTIMPASKETKQFAKNDVKNMDVQTQLGMNENKYNPQSRLQNARKTFKHEAFNKTLGKLFDLNTNLLEVEDNIGLKSMYVKALSDYITANKIDVNSITDAQLSKARQHAIKSAQEATFHQASSLATALQQMGNKNNLTKFALDAVVPFKKTPINVAKTGAQYSPIGLIKSAIFDVNKVRKGTMTANQYIDNISKGLTGTGITFLGYALAEAGILKASGGDDDKKEKYDEEQGKQSYALEIGGNTYSLDWLSPVGIPLFIGAETNQQFNQAKKEKNSKSTDDEETLSNILKGLANFANGVSNAMNPMSEMSMVSGLTNVLSSYNKENAVGDMIVNTGKSYVNQFVPTLLGQVARTTDDYERTTKSTKTGTLEKAFDSTINQIKSKIPGLRQTLPVKTDIWGQDVKQSENLPFRAFNNFINPAKVQEVSTDSVDKELNSLYAKTGESSIIPKSIDKNLTINKNNYRMTNEEYAKYSKDYGKTSHDLLQKLIKTDDYKKLTDKQKQKAIEDVYNYAKEANKVDYSNKVKEELETSSLYNTIEDLKKNGGEVSAYLNYKGKVSDIEGEKETMQKNTILRDSDYSNKTKSIIYRNNTGKNDKLYNLVPNINMNQYLDYKIKNSNEEFKADKDSNGKTITGSAKKKVYNYINSTISGYDNRLMLLGNEYKLSRAEQQEIANQINKTSKSNEEAMEKFKKLSSNFEIKNGKVYFK